MSVENMFSKIERRSKAESLYWAGVFIWAGLIFGANSLGFLPQIGNADAWSWMFLGAGLYGTSMNLYSAFMPDSVTTTWDYIWSGFWLVLGLSGFFAVDIIWPLALVLLGIVVLAGATRS
jgi:hypothetical protein